MNSRKNGIAFGRPRVKYIKISLLPELRRESDAKQSRLVERTDAMRHLQKRLGKPSPILQDADLACLFRHKETAAAVTGVSNLDWRLGAGGNAREFELRPIDCSVARKSPTEQKGHDTPK